MGQHKTSNYVAAHTSGRAAYGPIYLVFEAETDGGAQDPYISGNPSLQHAPAIESEGIPRLGRENVVINDAKTLPGYMPLAAPAACRSIRATFFPIQ